MSKNKPIRSFFILIFFAVLIAGFIIFNSIFNGKFLNLSNLTGVMTHAIIPSFIAWGLSFVFACGYVDLSIGGIIVLAANVASSLGNQFGYAGVLVGGLGVAILLLFLNFNIFVYSKIPSWIAGLGMAMIYEATAVIYWKNIMSKGVDLNSDYRALGQVPGIFIVFAVGLILAYFLYNRTTIGLNIRAIGSNWDVAKAIGIRGNITLLAVGLISGLFIGCAAFINISYNVRITAKTGLTSLSLIFQPLAVLLLAQVLQKKINLIIAIPICAFLISAIFNMLTIASIPSGTWQEAILGLCVIVFGIIAQRNSKGVVK
ncbi:MAG TPA: hypothetical protein DCM45_02835 [Clostridiales bacterium]|nr:hypothetical protein [Clostridiales bacterium]